MAITYRYLLLSSTVYGTTTDTVFAYRSTTGSISEYYMTYRYLLLCSTEYGTTTGLPLCTVPPVVQVSTRCSSTGM